MLINLIVCLHNFEDKKKQPEKFARKKIKPYLCSRYPENNLFTLKLIPIED